MKKRYAYRTKIDKQEWISMRLLFLLLASDPSNVRVADVKKTMDYFEARFGKGFFLENMWKLAVEHSILKTFVHNPDSKMVRDMNNSITDEKDDGTYEPRYFGTSHHVLREGNTNE
jgi:hypothetical protein